MSTFIGYPASYNATTYSYASIKYTYPLDNPIGMGSSNTTYTQINLKTGSNAETYVFYKFDCSSIPSNAVIDTVSCVATGDINNVTANRIKTHQIQMFYGTASAKGSASDMSTSRNEMTLNVGIWTRQELDNCNIRLYAQRSTKSTTTNYYIRFYGATLTVNYTVPGVGSFLYVQQNGVPVKVSTVYKKVGGIWVEQPSTELKTLFDTETKYVNAN